jgi:hypothetical protein
MDEFRSVCETIIVLAFIGFLALICIKGCAL